MDIKDTSRYDYLVVGSGLYGAVFAHEAKVHGKSVLVVDKRDMDQVIAEALEMCERELEDY